MDRKTVLVAACAAWLSSGTAYAAPTLLWQVDIDSNSYGSAAIDDVDGDCQLEVLFGTYFNDERVMMLNAEDGSTQLQVPSGGGPVDNSVTAADLDGDGVAEILWGNSATTLFHVMGPDGKDKWTYMTGEVLDAPEAVADLDGDGKLEVILASCATDETEGLRVLRGADGEVVWKAAIPGCYQSAPLIFDADGDDVLDVVVSTWFDSKVHCFSGVDGSLLWSFDTSDWMYHAGSFGDLDGDGVPEVAVGDMAGGFFVIHGHDGSLYWSADLDESWLFGPTAMADLDGDGSLEVIVAGSRIHVLSASGETLWSSDYLEYVGRGPVIADADGNGTPDVIAATDEPSVRAFDGASGKSLWTHNLPTGCETDFAPVVWDLTGDGLLDIFVVCGRGWYEPDQQDNWGVAVALRGEGIGDGWPTFSHDLHHSGNYHHPPGSRVNDPDWNPLMGCGGGNGDGGSGSGAGNGSGGSGNNQGNDGDGGAADNDADAPFQVTTGCSCRTHGDPGTSDAWLLSLLLLVWPLRRRRSSI